MSRIGRKPIAVPSGVTVTVGNDNIVTVKGPKGELKQLVDRDIKVEVKLLSRLSAHFCRRHVHFYFLISAHIIHPATISLATCGVQGICADTFNRIF